MLRNGGPLGGAGIPEWGVLPVPAKLLEPGVCDRVRISHARISGTADGTVVVRVTGESAVGGPLAAVRNGDWIELDVERRRLELQVDPPEIARQLLQTPAPPHTVPPRGHRRLYHDHVLQADRGCDFDFLLP